MMGPSVKVGDEVTVRARVVTVAAEMGDVKVEILLSAMGPQELWVREDQIVGVPGPAPVEEPPDGTYVLSRDHDGNSNIFHRDDAEGHCDPADAPERWWDFGGREWVSWPRALARGADRDQPLVRPAREVRPDRVVAAVEIGWLLDAKADDHARVAYETARRVFGQSSVNVAADNSRNTYRQAAQIARDYALQWRSEADGTS